MKSTNFFVIIFFPFTICVDVDVCLTFLCGMPVPFVEKLENEENLHKTTKQNYVD